MRISDWSSDVCSSDLPQKRRCQLEDRVHPVANHPDSRRMTMKRWFSRMGITLLFAALFAPAAMAANALDVYSEPSCGCCGAWVHYMRVQGYTVTVHQDQPIDRKSVGLGKSVSGRLDLGGRRNIQKKKNKTKKK